MIDANLVERKTNAAGTLILICGLPGSGKTTLAKQLETSKHAVRLCPDDWIEVIIGDAQDTNERDRLRNPVENLQWEFAKVLLSHGRRVILENGFWSQEERDQYAMEARAMGARIELHFLPSPPLDQLWNRVQRRNGELASPLFILTREELESAWDAFESPSQDELNFYDFAAVHA